MTKNTTHILINIRPTDRVTATTLEQARSKEVKGSVLPSYKGSTATYNSRVTMLSELIPLLFWQWDKDTFPIKHRGQTIAVTVRVTLISIHHPSIYHLCIHLFYFSINYGFSLISVGVVLEPIRWGECTAGFHTLMDNQINCWPEGLASKCKYCSSVLCKKHKACPLIIV